MRCRAGVYVPRLKLRAGPGGRYLVSGGGRPFRVQGDTAYGLFNELDATELETFLADCQSRGVNMLVAQATNPVRYVTSSHAPGAKGAGDVNPFLNASGGTWNQDPTFRDNILNGVSGTATGNFDADFSRPVAAYWDWVEYVLARCAAYGIVVNLAFHYMGFGDGSNDGWWQTLLQSRHTQAVCFAFGQYLGARFVNHPNLIHNIGVDMFPTSGSEGSARMRKIAEGLKDQGCTHLFTAHYKRSSFAKSYTDFADLVTLNCVYPGAGGSSYAPSHGRCRLAYALDPAIPGFMIEGKYEREFTFPRYQIREQGWWAHLSSIAGAVYGHGEIWPFNTGWASHLADAARVDHQRMGAFFDARDWSALVPNGLGAGTLITSGGGAAQTLGAVGASDTNDGNDYVAAACNARGTLWVGYVPDAHTGIVRVDMTKLRGTPTAAWFDPSNGSSQSAGTGLSNSGTHDFTVPGANNAGANDWVLELTAA